MRIAYVSVHTSPLDAPGHGDAGGLNVFVAETAAALARAGHEVDVFTRAVSTREVGSVEVAPGLRVHRIIAGPCRPLDKNQLVEVVDEFAMNLADFGPYDIVYSHYWISGLAVLRSEWRIPWVHSFHTLARMKAETIATPESDVRADTEQRICDTASAVCCVSEAEAHALRTLYGVPAARIRIIHPSVDASVFRRRGPKVKRRWRLWNRIPQDSVLVLSAGRLQPAKGQDIFAEAIARTSTDSGIVGVVLGDPPPGDEEFAEALRRRAQEPDLAGRFAVRPAVSRHDFALWLAIATVVAIPSRTESFGLVSLEAQAAGVPVVAHAVGGLPETLQDGVTGVLVDSVDPDARARVLEDLAENSVRRRQMGRAAHTFARESSWDDVAKDLADFFSSLD